MIITPYASFTRPADTTAYAQGDLVANSTTAGSVVPLRFGVAKMGRGSGVIAHARFFKDHQTVTNAKFNLHLFTQSPTVTNGDNGVFAVSTATYYLGKIVIDMTSGAFVTTTDAMKRGPFVATFDSSSHPNVLAFDLTQDETNGRLIYGLVEADAAYTPQSGETFKLWLEVGDDGAG